MWEESTTNTDLFYNVHRWYQPGTGRYSRVDPIPINDRVEANPYFYVLANPLSGRDPRGLVTWTCRLSFGTGNTPIAGVGVGGVGYECQSECVNGQSLNVRGIGFYGGVSVGRLPFGLSEADITLEDEEAVPMASTLAGFSMLGGVGLVTPGPSTGCSAALLGTATGQGCGPGAGGLDFGGDVYVGGTVVTNETPICCDE